ncbi:MAG: DUF5663 domain-containing protein [Microgenomates group bacterium]|jgi:hypothetical protein
MDKLEIPEDVRKYLESLLYDTHITLLDEEMKEEMIEEIYKRLDSYLAATIANKLPPEALNEFIKMNDENRPAPEVEAFIKEKMPDADQVFANAFVEFRNLYLGNTQPTEQTQPLQQAG